MTRHCSECGCFLKKVRCIVPRAYGEWVLQCNYCHFLFDMDLRVIGSPILWVDRAEISGFVGRDRQEPNP